MKGESATPQFLVGAFLLARAPVLPMETLAAWANATAHGSENGWLLGMLSRPEVLAAVRLASPSLGDHAGGVLAKSGAPLEGRARRAVVRYLLRMIGRSTPFGLFAGTTLGTVGDTTRLELGPRSDWQLFARLDGHALCNALDALHVPAAVRMKATVQLNSSAYEWGGDLHFIEASSRDRKLQYRRARATVDMGLDMVLRFVRGAPAASLADVARHLAAAGFPAEDAYVYVDQLLAEQVLVAGSAMPRISDSPVAQAAAEARSLAPGAEVTQALSAAAAALERASSTVFEAALSHLEEADAIVRRAKFSTDAEPTCDVQLRMTGQIAIGPELASEIEVAATVLARVHTPARTSPVGLLGQELERFRDAFVLRFGEAAVPLAIALDPDVGVGFRGADTPMPELPDPPRGFGRRERYLLNLVMRAAARGDRAITLSADDVSQLATGREQFLPASALLMARVGRLANGALQLYVGKWGGPIATGPMARFASGNAQLTTLLRDWHEQEAGAQGPGIDAEIIHAPTGDLLNIAARPALRPFEIAYLGAGSATRERTLGIGDLVVTVDGERVILYSRQHESVVRPYLTCAHAAHHADLPAAYRFLFAVATQRLDPSLMWQWGEEAESLAYLPRLLHGTTILSLARWRLSWHDLAALWDASAETRGEAMAALRVERDLPRYVMALTGGDELLFDLDNTALLDAFIAVTRENGMLEVREVFPEPGHSAVRGDAGSHMHEIMVPLRNASYVAPRPPTRFHPDVEDAKGSFLGDEWLYIRVGAGPRAAEGLLLKVAPELQAMCDAGRIDGWFFIRYADPSHHIRLRLRGKPDALRAVALPLLIERFRQEGEKGLVSDLRIDTYRPEIRRYGGRSALRHVEDIACAGSAAVVAALAAAANVGRLDDPDWRMACALGSTHRLFQVLVPDMARRLVMCHDIAEHAMAEVAHTPEQIAARRLQLSRVFREQRHALAVAVFDHQGEWTSVTGIWEQFASVVAPSADALRELDAEGALLTPYDDIVCSILHMHLNRVFVEEPRHHERIAYEFLYKLYKGRSARQHADPIHLATK